MFSLQFDISIKDEGDFLSVAAHTRPGDVALKEAVAAGLVSAAEERPFGGVVHYADPRALPALRSFLAERGARAWET